MINVLIGILSIYFRRLEVVWQDVDKLSILKCNGPVSFGTIYSKAICKILQKTST